MAKRATIEFWPMTADEQMRFLEFVEIAPAGAGGDEACWPWTGVQLRSGYGMFSLRRGRRSRMVLAHRISWAAHNKAAPPAGRLILHSCDNPRCCNPKHLRPGSHQDNSDDMHARDRHHALYLARQRGAEASAAVYSEEQRQQAIEMFRRRVSFKVIAETLGCHRVSVSRWVEQHQIETGWKLDMSASLARSQPAAARAIRGEAVGTGAPAPGKLRKRLPPPDPDSEVF